jgi:hypothetical protein
LVILDFGSLIFFVELHARFNPPTILFASIPIIININPIKSGLPSSSNKPVSGSGSTEVVLDEVVVVVIVVDDEDVELLGGGVLELDDTGQLPVNCATPPDPSGPS